MQFILVIILLTTTGLSLAELTLLILARKKWRRFV